MDHPWFLAPLLEPVGPGCGSIICFSKEFSGDADTAAWASPSDHWTTGKSQTSCFINRCHYDFPDPVGRGDVQAAVVVGRRAWQPPRPWLLLFSRESLYPLPAMAENRDGVRDSVSSLDAFRQILYRLSPLP